MSVWGRRGCRSDNGNDNGNAVPEGGEGMGASADVFIVSAGF